MKFQITFHALFISQDAKDIIALFMTQLEKWVPVGLHLLLKFKNLWFKMTMKSLSVQCNFNWKNQENSNFVGVFVFLFFLIPMFYPKIKFILKQKCSKCQICLLISFIWPPNLCTVQIYNKVFIPSVICQKEHLFAPRTHPFI